MRNCILASTSTVHGQTFLQYLMPQLSEFFKSTKELLFIPFARPSGISYQDYTSIVAKAMAPLDINVKGIHNFTSLQKLSIKQKGFLSVVATPLCY